MALLLKAKIYKIIRRLYELIPGKKNIFLILRKFYHPSDFMINHLYFGGSFNVNYKGFQFKLNGYNKRGFSLENKLFWYGFKGLIKWETQSVDLWITLVKDAKVIFDIGANTGFYSILAKAVNPDVKVFGFEPVEHIFKWYKNNCKLNQFDIKCYSIALSNKMGKANLYAEKTAQNIYSASLDPQFTKSHSTRKIHSFEVELFTLKEIIKQNNVSNIDVIKIDVEGFEAEVLEGMGDYLKIFKPTLLIEVLTDEMGEKVQNILGPIGYIYFVLNKQEMPKFVQKITKSEDFNYIACMPEIAKRIHLRHN